MKAKVIVTELTHNDLVNLFSTALEGNDGMSAVIPSEYKSLKEGDSYEDCLANILLKGGEIEIFDLYALESIEDGEMPTEDDFYGKDGINYVSHYAKDYTFYSFFGGILTYSCPTYRISLATLLKGMENEKAMPYIEELFVREGGDMYTAYNLLQVILFGEEIYG